MFNSTPIKAVADHFDVDIQQIRRLKNNEGKQKQIIDANSTGNRKRVMTKKYAEVNEQVWKRYSYIRNRGLTFITIDCIQSVERFER